MLTLVALDASFDAESNRWGLMAQERPAPESYTDWLSSTV